MEKNSTHLVWLLVALFALNTSGTVMAMEGEVARIQDQLHLELIEAVNAGKKEEVERLLNAGVNVNTTNKYGDTLLHLVAINGSQQVADLLLARGANVDSTDKNGQTPLYKALSYSKKIVRILLANGAKVDVADPYGRTPLHSGMCRAAVGIVGRLLEKGAKVDAIDHYGETPLHLAASFQGMPRLTPPLGLALRILDEGGEAAEELKEDDRRCNIPETVALLLAYDADTSIKNKKGQTPIDVAQTEEIRELIREATRERATIN